jgi:drug/metabolite transporter (DMT)-like permease
MDETAACGGGSNALEGGRDMNPIRLLAIVLIVAGVLGLMYGSFSYTKETHEAKLGPLEFSVQEKETVNVPQWAGVGAIIAGVLLLVVRTKN